MFKLYLSTLAMVGAVSASASKDLKNPFAYTCIDSTKYHDIALNSDFTCDDDNVCLCSHYKMIDKSWSCISGENPCGKSPKIPRYPTSSFQGKISLFTTVYTELSTVRR